MDLSPRSTPCIRPEIRVFPGILTPSVYIEPVSVRGEKAPRESKKLPKKRPVTSLQEWKQIYSMASNSLASGSVRSPSRSEWAVAPSCCAIQ